MFSPARYRSIAVRASGDVQTPPPATPLLQQHAYKVGVVAGGLFGLVIGGAVGALAMHVSMSD